jgi:hypothetical protein
MIPLLALGSSIDSSLHPRFLIHYDEEANEQSPLMGQPDSGQQDAILGDGSGLKRWGKGKITVYNEGKRLLICDQEGGLRVERS